MPTRVRDLVDQRGSAFECVLLTKFRNAENSNFRRLINWNRLSDDVDTAIDERLDGIGLVVEKETYSAVADILPILKERRIEHVFICGIDTDVCVLQHAAGFFDAGLVPVVLADACATTAGSDIQDAALVILRRTIGAGQVLTLDS